MIFEKVMDVCAASIQEPFRTRDFSEEEPSMEYNWSVQNVPLERLPQGKVDFASNAQKLQTLQTQGASVLRGTSYRKGKLMEVYLVKLGV